MKEDNTWTTCNKEKDTVLIRAIIEQISLGNYTLEKGYMSTQWTRAKRKWNHSSGMTKTDDSTWTRKVIITLQEYSYNLWKKQNTFIHGEKKKGHKQKHNEICQG